MPVQGRIIDQGFTAVRQYRHGYLMMNKNEATVLTKFLELYGEWCESELELAGLIIRPGDIVIDVGANIGTHTVFYAQKVGPTGFVFAFEPQTVMYQYLCGNLMLNSLSNVTALKAAVGNEPGSITVPTLDPNQSSGFAGVSLEDASEGEQVQLITIDQLNLPTLRFMKIDVEGMELKVLQGARGTIQRLRPYLFMESNPDDSPRGKIEFLQAENYTCWWFLSPYYNPENFYGNPNNYFAQLLPDIGIFAAPKERSVAIEGMVKVEGPDDTWAEAVKRI